LLCRHAHFTILSHPRSSRHLRSWLLHNHSKIVHTSNIISSQSNTLSSLNFWTVSEGTTTEFREFSFDDLAACATPPVNTFPTIMDSLYCFEGGKNKPTPIEIDTDTDFLDLLDPINEQSLDLNALIQATIGIDGGSTGEPHDGSHQLFPELLSKSELDQVNTEVNKDLVYQFDVQELSFMPQHILVDIPTVPDSEESQQYFASPAESLLPPEIDAASEFGSESHFVDDTILNIIPEVKTEAIASSCTTRKRHSTGHSTASSSDGGGKITRRRAPPKDTDEYRCRRDRNNVAVRKSRDKAKEKQGETEKRVTDLTKKNDELTQRCDLLEKELNVLRSLFTNIGAKVPQEYNDFINSEH